MDELVGRVGEVARYFLFNCTFFLGPFLIGVVDAAKARGLRLQRNIKVRCWDGRIVLGDVLLGVRIVFAAELRVDGGRLIGAHPRASAKSHVFLGVGHAWKAGGGFISANEEIGLNGDHRCEGIADNDHMHSVSQCNPRNWRLGWRRRSVQKHRRSGQ